LRWALALCSEVLGFDPPICASLNNWDDRCAPTHPITKWDGGGSQNFLARLASNFNPPNFFLPSQVAEIQAWGPAPSSEVLSFKMKEMKTCLCASEPGRR
jgi:hypothetical protein